MNLRSLNLTCAILAWAAPVGVADVFAATSGETGAERFSDVKENQEVHVWPSDFCTRNQTYELMIANPVKSDLRSSTLVMIERERDSVVVTLQDNSDVNNTRDAVAKLGKFIVLIQPAPCASLQTWRVKGFNLRGLHVIQRPDGQPDFDFRKD